MSNVPDWQIRARRHLANPKLVIGDALDALEAATEGRLDITTPVSPYMHLLEAGAVNASALWLEQEALHRRMYPSMALTQDDLYRHMSNEDYASRFSQPARATFQFMMSLEEVRARAVEFGISGVRKLTIPRHTNIEVAGTVFTMQYPIDIRIMPHGGLSVVYDNSRPSPIHALDSNVVRYSIRRWRTNDVDQEYLAIEVPVYQLKIESHEYSTSRAALSEQSYTFGDNFHYARVFTNNSQGQWVEIRTTHTDQVFDPSVPTAVLKVDGQVLTIRIPQIYQTTGTLVSELRVDIYTTRGPIEMTLSDYQVSSFQAHWTDLDQTGSNPYVDALIRLNDMALFSESTVSGGRRPMSLSALRERVITNSLGKVNVPITSVNIGSRLADLGFDMVLDVDNVTNRQFLATRSLPENATLNTISGAGCTMLTMTESMENLGKLTSVVDNGERITILPQTLFQNVNGVITIVPQPVINSINALPLDVRARRINENNFLYTPFHYVMDMTNDRFEYRPYYLDNPSILHKNFVTENPTGTIEVAVRSYQISRVDDGYLITLVVRGGQSWKDLQDSQVYCQLGFVPSGERLRAYQNGTLAGLTAAGDRVYTFLIGTDYDLDANDALRVSTFQMLDDPVHVYGCPLELDFDVFFAVSQLVIEDFAPSTIDEDMGLNLLPDDAIGLSHERLRARLGKSMAGLWTASRSVASAQHYRRYLSDVPAVYESTVYRRDPVSGAIDYTIDPDTGDVQFVVLHAKGDPVLNDQNEPVMKYFAGDVMHDVEGNPIIESTRRVLRQIDIFLVDGVYWFASEQASLDYRAEIPGVILGWLENDISQVKGLLLEQTSLFFYPKSTLGNVNVKVMEDRTVSINSSQSFMVTFHVTGTAFRDAELRASLTRVATQVIHEQLQNAIVSHSDIVAAIRDQVGSDAIGITVTGLGGATPYDTISLTDHSARLSIRKKAVAKADGTIGVEDDVSVNFLMHSPT